MFLSVMMWFPPVSLRRRGRWCCRRRLHADLILDAAALDLDADSVRLAELVGAVVVEALEALLPGGEVAGVQIGDRDVGREEEVHALALVDECLPVGGKFNDPALVEFDGGLEDVAHFLRKVLTVLHGAVMGDDVGPESSVSRPRFASSA